MRDIYKECKTLISSIESCKKVFKKENKSACIIGDESTLVICLGNSNIFLAEIKTNKGMATKIIFYNPGISWEFYKDKRQIQGYYGDIECLYDFILEHINKKDVTDFIIDLQTMIIDYI